MIKAILFDLDGTLANTNPIHFAIWQDFLREYDLAIDQDFYDDRISGRLNTEILADILPRLSETERRSFSDRKEAEFRRRAKHDLEPLAGLLDFLAWVDTHQLKQAVVTNAPPGNAYFMLDTLNLRGRFPIVVIGQELANGKPHPLPYQVGLEKVGVSPSEAIAFEDSPSGVRSAATAGIFTVGITSTHPAPVLIEAGAIATIQDFADPRLHELIQQANQAGLESDP